MPSGPSCTKKTLGATRSCDSRTNPSGPETELDLERVVWRDSATNKAVQRVEGVVCVAL